MKTARHAALEEAARKIKDSIPWSRYRKLAEVFRHRPYVNIYWLELVDLMHWHLTYASGERELHLSTQPVHEFVAEELKAWADEGYPLKSENQVPRDVQLRDAASKALTWIESMRQPSREVADELRAALVRFG